MTVKRASMCLCLLWIAGLSASYINLTTLDVFLNASKTNATSQVEDLVHHGRSSVAPTSTAPPATASPPHLHPNAAVPAPTKFPLDTPFSSPTIAEDRVKPDWPKKRKTWHNMTPSTKHVFPPRLEMASAERSAILGVKNEDAVDANIIPLRSRFDVNRRLHRRKKRSRETVVKKRRAENAGARRNRMKRAQSFSASPLSSSSSLPSDRDPSAPKSEVKRWRRTANSLAYYAASENPAPRQRRTPRDQKPPTRRLAWPPVSHYACVVRPAAESGK